MANKRLLRKKSVMSIKIIVAEPHGFCGNDKFGVTRAIMIAQKTAKQYPGKVYLLGEIVHNQHVVAGLEKDYGVITVHHLAEIPSGATVIIRAHGAAPAIYQKAKAKGLKIVDATCPLVAQVHREVKKLAVEGKQILYVASDYKHDEALGVAGEAPDKVKLITLADLNKQDIANPDNTVVITQTTLSILETKEVLDKLRKKYSTITIRPHICSATTDRQKAVMMLAKQTKTIIIVGSPTSSNSKRLKEVAEASGAKTYMVDIAADLKPEWFQGVNQIGVSSGASTPEEILNETIERIRTM